MQPSTDLQFRSFQSGDEAVFCRLNQEWIEEHFGMEQKDYATLGNPVEYIIRRGGQVFLALFDGVPAGCCALLATPPGEFEVSKMAVEKSLRGRGIGRQLLAYTIGRAQALGATRLYLETSTKLPDAIHLYESLGFRHLPAEQAAPSTYGRTDVFMQLLL
jgi:putative acetyltransferase